MLRDATDDDLPALRRWRNHPDVRNASFTTHVISAEEHLRWWTAVRADPARRVLVYEHEGVPAGVSMYTGLGGPAPTWSYYLDVEGLGERALGAWVELERAAIRYAFETLRLEVLHAETLAANRAVRALNRRCGFLEKGSYLREIDGEEQEVVRLEITPNSVPRALSRKR